MAAIMQTGRGKENLVERGGANHAAANNHTALQI